MLWLYDLSYSSGAGQAAVDCSAAALDLSSYAGKEEVRSELSPKYLMQTQWKISESPLQGVLLLDGRPAIRVYKGSRRHEKELGEKQLSGYLRSKNRVFQVSVSASVWTFPPHGPPAGLSLASVC